MNLDAILDKADKLPLGHYGKKAAQAIVDLEYDACHKQAQALVKKHKISKHYFEPQEAFDLCLAICAALGHRPLKHIVIRSDKVSKHASAHYSRREIHFPHNYIHTTTLLHELAHHLCRGGGHGKEFCEIQELVYEAAMQINKEGLQSKNP